VAYAVLERAGELQPSRLKELEPAAGLASSADPTAALPPKN
jgi:hypothetical protein